MDSYSDFAYIYDHLMHKDIDYEKWADYIEDLFIINNTNPDLVCDLCCGTGSITTILASRGYNMTGVDMSCDMLEVARQKSKNLDILYLNQSITKLDLYGSMDAFLCMIDGINYILVPESLKNIFTKIFTCFLDPGGIFIFDISSQYKLSHIIANNTFIHSERDIFYSWRNNYISKLHISDMFLDFFIKQGKGYKRFEERHLQRAWSEKEVRFLLSRSGFQNIHTYDALSFDKPNQLSERIVFTAQKPK